MLADPTAHAVLKTLGERQGQALSALELAEHAPPGTTPRLVRDRIRELERSGIVESAGAAPARGAPPPDWRLTAAGLDLVRLHALMARIAERASETSPTAPAALRERVVQRTLAGLSDPVVLQVIRCLATAPAPLDPVELEVACAPTARRTLYRRLGVLVDGGIVKRIAGRQVPRSTHYELARRWRPAAAIPVLAIWWESRHLGEAVSGSLDLSGLVAAVLPLTRLGAPRDGATLTWVLDDASAPVRVDLGVTRDRVHRGQPAPGENAQATARGDVRAWAAALVTDRADGLTFGGDERLARETLGAVRAALLAYVR